MQLLRRRLLERTTEEADSFKGMAVRAREAVEVVELERAGFDASVAVFVGEGTAPAVAFVDGALDRAGGVPRVHPKARGGRLVLNRPRRRRSRLREPHRQFGPHRGRHFGPHRGRDCGAPGKLPDRRRNRRLGEARRNQLLDLPLRSPPDPHQGSLTPMRTSEKRLQVFQRMPDEAVVLLRLANFRLGHGELQQALTCEARYVANR